MKSIRTKSYHELFAKLPSDVQKQALKANRLFEENPFNFIPYVMLGWVLLGVIMLFVLRGRLVLNQRIGYSGRCPVCAFYPPGLLELWHFTYPYKMRHRDPSPFRGRGEMPPLHSVYTRIRLLFGGPGNTFCQYRSLCLCWWRW